MLFVFARLCIDVVQFCSKFASCHFAIASLANRSSVLPTHWLDPLRVGPGPTTCGANFPSTAKESIMDCWSWTLSGVYTGVHARRAPSTACMYDVHTRPLQIQYLSFHPINNIKALKEVFSLLL